MAAGDTLDLTFESASAVGFDVFPGFVAPGDVLISVFDSVNAPMGTFTILASPGGTFFGVLSDSGLIGRINVDTVAEYRGRDRSMMWHLVYRSRSRQRSFS